MACRVDGESWDQIKKSRSRSLIYGTSEKEASRGVLKSSTRMNGSTGLGAGPRPARNGLLGRQALHSAGQGQGPVPRTGEQDAGKDKFSRRFRGKHRSEM